MEVNSSVLLKIFLIVLSAPCFMMISCGNGNPCLNIKNGLDYKKGESYDNIVKIVKEDFGKSYSAQYDGLIKEIKKLYNDYKSVEGQEENNEDYESDNDQDGNDEDYESDNDQDGNDEDYESDNDQEENSEDYESDNEQEENSEDYESDESDKYQDVEYNPSDGFITRVRGIVEKNEKIYEETYKQIDKYTRKIPPMPWAFGCTIKGLVMYILHNPIIKCAVQYFDNYKYTRDEKGKAFDEMVMEPKEHIDEWHNCMVTFIRLLKLTYEELDSDETDVKVHGRLWNQIQGLEYLLHFLCFGYRQGHFPCSYIVCFLKVFLDILGVFDFSKKPEVFGLGDKKLKHSAYFSYRTGLDEDIVAGYQEKVSEKYSDFICSKKVVCFSENIYGIISKSNRTNWMIYNKEDNHVFHFYLCKNEDETVYYIHDGWYEYQNFINRKLPKPNQTYYCYSIPFTYIILPTEVSVKQKRVININNVFEEYEIGMQFWDSLIPLLSTNLDLVKKCSEKLYDKFEYSNENEKEVLFRYFLNYLVSLISDIVETRFKLDKNQDEFNFKDYLEVLLLFNKVEGDVLPKDGKNTDIFEINNYYYSEKKKIDDLYSDKRNNGKEVENKLKVQLMLQLLRKTINKMWWFLRSNKVVGFILEYYGVIYKKKELQVAFIKNIKENPAEINEMFEEYVKKYFSNIREAGEDFVFENLVHGVHCEKGANSMYDGNKYKQADVLRVNWDEAGLSYEDLPIFREKFEKYKFFKSATFDDDV